MGFPMLIARGVYRGIRRELNSRKEDAVRQRVHSEFVNRWVSDLVVLGGPFKGMRYPSVASVCSTNPPKLIGSYEKELHKWIFEMLKSDFEVVVDIGCAEGYYAVGFALNGSSSRVIAFDTDPNARSLCREMAELNGVQDSCLLIQDECTKESLLSLCAGKKSLVICDIEGSEKELFDSELIQSLKSTTFLIETHDCYNIEISTMLKEMFKFTHDVSVAVSVDDIQKAKYFDFEVLEGYSLQDRRYLLEERRGFCQEWLLCSPTDNG